jgi:ComF family protein
MKLFSQLLDIIYPPRCALCGRFISLGEKYSDPSHICDHCAHLLIPITHPLCTVCGTPFASSNSTDHICENCIRRMPCYDMMRAPYLYTGPLMHAIQKFKYNSETHIALPLGKLLSAFAKTVLSNLKEFVAVPVPLHKDKLKERGFNQSLLLAKVVSSELELSLDYLSLTKEKSTRSQTGLGGKERMMNVVNAFSVNSAANFKGKKVMLIDDVITTGCTLNECAKTLKKAGAIKVICIALARTANH